MTAVLGRRDGPHVGREDRPAGPRGPTVRGTYRTISGLVGTRALRRPHARPPPNGSTSAGRRPPGGTPGVTQVPPHTRRAPPMHRTKLLAVCALITAAATGFLATTAIRNR